MRVLIAFASKYGATQGIADAIAKSLAQRALSVDVLPASEASGVSTATTRSCSEPTSAGSSPR